MGSISRRRGTGSRRGWMDGLTSGLVHLWEFDGNEVDAVGGLSGSINGNVSFTIGKIKKCAYFNGGYMTTSGNLNVDNWTASFWVKLDELADAGIYGIIFLAAGQNGNGFRISAKKFNYCHYTNTPTSNIQSNEVLPGTDAWIHIAAKFPNVVFINGIQSTMEAGRTFNALNSVNPYIGADNYSVAVRSLKGSLEQLAIWSRTLSDSEILQIYNSGKGLKYK
jgi:hypothetical protein